MAARLSVIVALAYAAWPSVLVAQSAVTPKIVPRSPTPVGIQREAIAPDWLVWRAFHDSLEFYDKQKPGLVLQLLDERLGLSEGTALALLEAGRAYLGVLASLDREVRERIKGEYQSNGVLEFPSTVRRPNGEPVRSDFLAGKTPDGRELRDALVADGVLSQLEEQRRSTLRRHLQHVAELVDARQLAMLDDWVRAEVAPRVAVSVQAVAVDSPFEWKPAPSASGTGGQ